jgi:hypothetical protein
MAKNDNTFSTSIYIVIPKRVLLSGDMGLSNILYKEKSGDRIDGGWR